MEYAEEFRKTDMRIEQKADDALVAAQQLKAVFKNRTYPNITTAPTATTAGMSLIPLSAKLVARISGIFMVGCSLAYTGWMGAETTTVSVQSLTASFGTMSFATSTLVGPVGVTAGAGGGVIAAAAQAGARVSSAAAGIVVTGGAGSLTQYNSGTLVQATAGTTFNWSWQNIISNTVSAVTPFAEVPFTIGNEVVVTVTINHSATTGTCTQGTIWMMELPMAPLI